MATHLLLLVSMLATQAPELVDRTLAIVAGRTVTLSDARTALALHLVEGAEVDSDVVQRLVDRELMLREIDRYDPPEPAAARVDERMAAARAVAGGEDGLARVLRDGGFAERRLRAWIRDDLRIDAYLQQRFAADERRPDLIADWLIDLRRRTPVTVIAP
jgi:hypothetical protein